MVARAQILGDEGKNHPDHWVGGLARPDLHASPRQESTWVGGVFLILGVAADIIAVTRYSLARRALLAGKEIGAGPLPMVMAVLVSLFGLVISVYMLRHLI